MADMSMLNPPVIHRIKDTEEELKKLRNRLAKNFVT